MDQPCSQNILEKRGGKKSNQGDSRKIHMTGEWTGCGKYLKRSYLQKPRKERISRGGFLLQKSIGGEGILLASFGATKTLTRNLGRRKVERV